jgi:uncharacterized membrane protein
MRASRILLLTEVAVAVLQMAHYYPLMPETMASHFDGAGRPNGFQSRGAFFALTGVMLLVVVGVFAGLASLLRRLPASWVNLPHREFWLAPERRESTVDFIGQQMEWYGVATLLLLLLVVQAAIEANLTPEPRLDSGSMWVLLGLYFLYVAVWLVRFLRHFRVPRPAPR